ncbi:MAG TPA: alpha/beta hydrolase [Chitinophagaceae bacterium]|nr:alpha/beta hydrolase [Chitinophagaceae bacterium]
MKQFLSIISFLIICVCTAQGQAPTADQIRQRIAQDVYSLKIAPAVVYKIDNRKVWTGEDSIAVRLYYPAPGKQQPIIYQVHGGALVAGNLDTHDNICRLLANRTHAIVVAVDYRKPPEAPYPASLNDCAAVLHWIIASAKTWGGDIRNLSLLGDSGGGLLITALAIKEQQALPVKKMVLINPAVDLRTPGEGLYGLVTNMYLQGQSANDSLVSPILAHNFAFFPPTLIITCEQDILKPHGQALYDKLQQAGVRTVISDIAGQDHLGSYWSATHPAAQGAIDKSVAFITGDQKALARPGK